MPKLMCFSSLKFGTYLTMFTCDHVTVWMWNNTRFRITVFSAKYCHSIYIYLCVRGKPFRLPDNSDTFSHTKNLQDVYFWCYSVGCLGEACLPLQMSVCRKAIFSSASNIFCFTEAVSLPLWLLHQVKSISFVLPSTLSLLKLMSCDSVPSPLTFSLEVQSFPAAQNCCQNLRLAIVIMGKVGGKDRLPSITQ